MVFVCAYSKMWNGKEDLPWQCYRTMCKRIASEFRGLLKIFMILYGGKMMSESMYDFTLEIQGKVGHNLFSKTQSSGNR